MIVGASVRPAAESFRAAGFRVAAADLFGDRDLRAAAEVVVRAGMEDWPAGLLPAVAAIDGLESGAWRTAALVFTGALENHPALVGRLAAGRPLWGAGPDVLRRVRSLRRLHAAAARWGVAVPETRSDPAGLPADGTWLVKPLRGAGGAGVERWSGGTSAGTEGGAGVGGKGPGQARGGRRQVWQRIVDGTPAGAIFVGRQDGAAELLGVSRQLLSEPASRSGGAFRYCGSVGPLRPPDTTHAAVVRIGAMLASEFGMRGVFGADVVLAPRGNGGEPVPVLVEVNPRWTASVEVVEAGTGVNAAVLHAAAFGGAPSTDPPVMQLGTSRPCGKLVIFAVCEVRTPGALPVEWPTVDGGNCGSTEAGRAVRFAVRDIPVAGEVTPPGMPVLTAWWQGGPDDDVADGYNQPATDGIGPRPAVPGPLAVWAGDLARRIDAEWA